MTRPPSMRPITGTGNARSRRASASTAPPRSALGASGVRASPALGSSDTGSAPLPIWLRGLDHCHRRRAVECLARPAARAARPSPRSRRAGRVSSRSAGSRAASRSGSAYSRNTASSAASRILSRRSARFSGFFASARDQLGAADDKPGLRPAEQLVAAERHQIGAGLQRLGDGRLVRQAPAFEIDQRAAAEILDKRQAALARQLRQPRRRHRSREALDFVIAGMDLEDQRRSPARSRRRSRADACGWSCRPRAAACRRAA